tara:strand:- start:43 stop:378 length:336 start_codon:yes stop_codon:yes gene_type:complete
MMTLPQCNAHLLGFNHMAKIIDHPTMYHSVPDDTDEKQYIKTFDCCDDPIVFTITRNSYYTEKNMICGVFDHIDSAMCRLKRLLEQNPRDGEKLTIEAHNLRSIEQEEDLD